MAYAPGYTYQGQPGGASATASGIGNAGTMFSLFGVIAQAVSSYYAAEASRYDARSTALALEHQSRVSQLNARAAEAEAESILEAGQSEVARVGREYARLQAETNVSTAAHGVQAGVGNAAEVSASIELARQIDALTINRNAARAAASARMDSVNNQNQSLFASIGARNARRTARSINPYLAAGTALVSGGAGVANTWTQNQRWQAWAARNGGGS